MPVSAAAAGVSGVREAERNILENMHINGGAYSFCAKKAVRKRN